MFKIVGALAIFGLVSCAHVHTFHQDALSLEEAKGKAISSEATKFIVLFFNFNNDFVTDAYKGFKAQCPNGRINGVSSRLSSTNHLLSWTYKFKLAGYCVKKENEKI